MAEQEDAILRGRRLTGQLSHDCVPEDNRLDNHASKIRRPRG